MVLQAPRRSTQILLSTCVLSNVNVPLTSGCCWWTNPEISSLTFQAIGVQYHWKIEIPLYVSSDLFLKLKLTVLVSICATDGRWTKQSRSIDWKLISGTISHCSIWNTYCNCIWSHSICWKTLTWGTSSSGWISGRRHCHLISQRVSLKKFSENTCTKDSWKTYSKIVSDSAYVLITWAHFVGAGAIQTGHRRLNDISVVFGRGSTATELDWKEGSE